MEIQINVPDGVLAAAQLKAARTGRSVDREVKELFNQFMPIVADQTLTYKDIALAEDMNPESVGRLASQGKFGKLIRRNRKDVRVSIEGYVRWKRGRGK